MESKVTLRGKLHRLQLKGGIPFWTLVIGSILSIIGIVVTVIVALSQSNKQSTSPIQIQQIKEPQKKSTKVDSASFQEKRKDTPRKNIFLDTAKTKETPPTKKL